MASKQPSVNDRILLLEQRIQHLEQVNSWHMQSLDILSSMGYMHGDAAENRKPSHIFKLTREHLNRILELDSSAFLLVDEDDSEFELNDCLPESQTSYLQQQIGHLIENGSFAWAINQNRAIKLDTRDGAHKLLLHVLASRTRVRGMFIAQLTDAHDTPSPATLQLLSIILNNTAYALESAALYSLVHKQNRVLEAALKQQAHELESQYSHDTLTGLPNRLLFNDRIQQAMVRAQHQKLHLAVILLDIDNFKRINEAIGATAGDRLLMRVAKRLMGLHKEPELVEQAGGQSIGVNVARFGGDEFAILISDLVATESVNRIINAIHSRLTERIDIDGRDVEVTTSIGVSIYPGDANDAEHLLQNAEVAMYQAQQQGRNTAQYYAREMNTSAYQQLLMENHLRFACQHEEFFLNYQPKVDTLSGQLTGFESLIRWDNPEYGTVPPAQFIPMAEETGLIKDIGNWVLESACRQTKKWLDAGFNSISVAINLSARQFRQPDLVEQIVAILEKTGLSARYIELEITESTLMEDIDRAVTNLNRLHDLGIHLSIDDFGTGYSSLYYLKQFPIDKLKIDRQFIKDITTNANDAIMVRAIIAMAHNMGLRIVAEGVETGAQCHFLHTLGCDELQGYLISRAVGHNEATRMLKRSSLFSIEENCRS